MATSGQSSWLAVIKKAHKTALLQDGRIKVHYELADGREMSEEYDKKTEELLVRKWRKKTRIGGDGGWEWEVGEEGHYARQLHAAETDLLRESSSAPFVVRRDTTKSFEWRIRNLPYPADVYSITVEPDAYSLVLRTSNKKYFKRILVTDLQRNGLPTEQSAVTFAHANNTLIISYKKPKEILEVQKAVYLELAKLLKGKKDGDVNCTQT